MVNVDDAFEVRYKKAGEMFEVLVDFDKLNEFKKKPNEVSVYDVVADVKIFKDQRKGDIASTNLLFDVFKTYNEEVIIKEILLKGECQIPTSYLNKLRDEKKMQVVNYIVENAVNPASKMKYTPSMIESEVSKLKYSFDPNVGFERQAEEVIKLLKKVMPISVDKVVLEIEVPGMYVGAFYGPFRKMGQITKEYYDNSGNLRMHMEVTQSQVDNVIEFIKAKTNNEASYFVKSD